MPAVSEDKILRIRASGDTYTVGLTHGRAAKTQIHRLLGHYTRYVETERDFPWDQARLIAERYERFIASNDGDLYEEMKGIAEGSGAELIDIVALNCRTELVFGGEKSGDVDGCSSFSWYSHGEQWSGQNWDWKSWGRGNLVLLELEAYPPTGRPALKTITEAGIVGKIGFNEHGVSVQLNALKGRERNLNGTPTHIFQRRLLEQTSVANAKQYLEEKLNGHAAACFNCLVADPSTSINIEMHPYTHGIVSPKDGIIVHTNHPVTLDTKDFEAALEDSNPRLKRLTELLNEYSKAGRQPTFETCREALSDRSLGAAGICRHQDDSGMETVFNFTVNCTRKVAEIKMGKPDEGGELIELVF